MTICEKVQAIIDAPSCCRELKESAQAWIGARGTDRQAGAAQALVDEIREDVADIDHVISFFGSERGIAFFGKEKADQLLAHAREVKAAGGEFCDCPACAAGLEVLKCQEELF